ncbi:hypothetical protein H4S14_003469 [Agrobacterium vitis]|nr:hypothetical protein [Agrobacterium vitis]MBE1439704.1 hypothetical protein [Agrobacterium vitis]
MPRDDQNLVHSVAFRVTEAQWVILQRYAEDNEKTIPQLTKETLFEKVGLESPAEVRRRYGQTK